MNFKTVFNMSFHVPALATASARLNGDISLVSSFHSSMISPKGLYQKVALSDSIVCRTFKLLEHPLSKASQTLKITKENRNSFLFSSFKITGRAEVFEEQDS